MSYLHDPRFIFTGDFQSDVSTVNNDVRHYDNDSFEERFQQPEDLPTYNGWWNPVGGANFRFLNCTVKEGYLPDGKIMKNQKDDILIGLPVTGSPDRPNGKMLDLDPQMQIVSAIYGVRVRLSTADGDLLLEGEISPVGFRDINRRQYPNSTNDKDYNRNRQPSGACWTSVLENLKWGEKSSQSPVLSALKSASPTRLSIHLNSYGYYYTHVDGRFSLGRILGSISPYLPDEPLYFPATRRLYGTVNAPGSTSTYFLYSNFIVDEKKSRLTLDLGNSYPTNGPLGDINENFTNMIVAVSKIPIDIEMSNDQKYFISPQYVEPIISINPDKNWLDTTGGIVTTYLTKELLTLLQNNQLVLLKPESGLLVVYARESRGGYYMRADQSIFRLDPDDSLSTTFYAYRYGKPIPNANIGITLMDPLDDQGGGPPSDPNPPTAKIPPINVPAGKISYPSILKTGANGKIDATLTAIGDPENFREYVEGQIYLYPYTLNGVQYFDQCSEDFLCVHLRDRYNVPASPTWTDVAHIWLQFGNLYPIMSKHIMNMSKMDDIIKHKDILLFAFTRDFNDPVYMPVTRDLSKNKMDTLIKWLKEPKPGEVVKNVRALKGFRAPEEADKVRINKQLSAQLQKTTLQKSMPSEALPQVVTDAAETILEIQTNN